MKTKVKIEYFAGDVTKIIGEQCNHMSDYDKLQSQEIKAVIRNYVTRNAIDLVLKGVSKRPKAPQSFLNNYNSHNLYTVSKSHIEKRLIDRLNVILLCYYQMLMYDGIDVETFLALCDSYVDHHIFEIDL
jgi:hypothetical protein